MITDIERDEVCSVEDQPVLEVARKIRKTGFGITGPGFYRAEELLELQLLQDSYSFLGLDAQSPNRERSVAHYLREASGDLRLLPHKVYQQTGASVDVNPRLFQDACASIKQSRLLRELLRVHSKIGALLYADMYQGAVLQKCHFVRYKMSGHEVSTSNPPFMHIDRPEWHVQVILVSKTRNVLGGVNMLAHGQRMPNAVPDMAVNLNHPLDGLTLYRDEPHLVTPHSSDDGAPAFRDILILTAEPMPS